MSDHAISSTPAAAPAARRSRRGLGIFGLIAAAGVVVLVVTGIDARHDGNAKLQQWTEAQAIPTVAIATLNTKPVVTGLDFPGRLEANLRAPIFARVSGYVKGWNVDIGATVKAGDVLAEIEAPDLDQQLLQAQADVGSAKAAAALAVVTLSRGKSLLTTNAISQQEVDQRNADLQSKQAAVNAAEANVERLQVLSRYKAITAPFDGQVTERNTDVGDLISAGSSAGPAMFIISDVHKLRVSINVPQNYAPQIKIGSKASLKLPEYPGRTFDAIVEASARSVDVASGTTHMQLIVDNSKGELMPGAFATVHADFSGETNTVRIPVSALIFDKKGLHVATVGGDDRVLFKQITIARDLGSEIEVGSGVEPDDRVIAAPPDGLADGDQVRVAGAPAKVGLSADAAAKTGVN